jgi:arylsulfatase A-like enzyme
MIRRNFLRLLAAAPAFAQSRQPNIILVLADDLGYGDIGPYGASGYQTPNLDRMAAEGMKLTSYYAPCPVCTPTRTALMTGCYPVRVGLGYRVLFPYSIHGLHPDEITVADILKAQGYATACIGKWHLGHLPKFLPTKQGFDHYFGIPYSNDMGNVDNKMIHYKSPPTPLMRGEESIEHDPDQRFLTRRYAGEAVRFIAANKDRPFFLYLAHNMPHNPIAASEKFAGSTSHGKYGDVVSELDWSMGEIFDALRANGLDEKTLVIFTSDNGPVVWQGQGRWGYRSASAGPLRGAKGSVWEGGVRAPFIARLPGRIPKGGVSNELAAGFDLLPTFAKLAGGSAPADRIIDGRDIWPLLSGQKGAKTPHEVFYYYNNEQLLAIRSGKWKLHLPSGELYDLDADIGEKNNAAAQNPQVVRKLQDLAELARVDLGDALQRRIGRNLRTVGQLDR